METFKEYLTFKKFVTPIALQFLFWAGIGGTLYGTWWLFINGNWAWIMAFVFGTIGTRLVFENFILRYQTYICLKEIRDKMNEKD